MIPVLSNSASPSPCLPADIVRAANIHPTTGLATDYLNRFNEAIMLLDMVPEHPQCAGEFLDWRPLSYRDHFIASGFVARDLVVAAYDQAPADIRERFDSVCEIMMSILTAVREAMSEAGTDSAHAQVAQQAVKWLHPLVAQAAAIVNGTSCAAIHDNASHDVDLIMTPRTRAR